MRNLVKIISLVFLCSIFTVNAQKFEPKMVMQDGSLNTDRIGIDFITDATQEKINDLIFYSAGQEMTQCTPGQYNVQKLFKRNETEAVVFRTAWQHECPQVIFDSGLDKKQGMVYIRRYTLNDSTRLYAYYNVVDLAFRDRPPVDAFIGIMQPDLVTPVVDPVVSDVSVNNYITPFKFIPYSSKNIKKYVPIIYNDITIPLISSTILSTLIDSFNIDLFEAESLPQVQWDSVGTKVNTCLQAGTEEFWVFKWKNDHLALRIPPSLNCPNEIYSLSPGRVYYKGYSVNNRLLYAYYDYVDAHYYNKKTLLGFMFLN